MNRTEDSEGFGVRRLCGALGMRIGDRKRRRTAALQDAGAATNTPNGFMVPMHVRKQMEALHEPPLGAPASRRRVADNNKETRRRDAGAPRDVPAMSRSSWQMRFRIIS